MPQIDPSMTTEKAMARTDAIPWREGTLVWATWPASGPWPEGPGIPMEWVPGRVLGPAREERAREVEVEVYGGREIVPRADVELLLRHVSEKRRALIRCGAGMAPDRPIYQITYLHDGKMAGQSLARGDEIEAWRADLTAAGYSLEE